MFTAFEASQPKPTQMQPKPQPAAVAAMVSEAEVLAEPPPEFEFIVDPPAISRRHLYAEEKYTHMYYVTCTIFKKRGAIFICTTIKFTFMCMYMYMPCKQIFIFICDMVFQWYRKYMFVYLVNDECVDQTGGMTIILWLNTWSLRRNTWYMYMYIGTTLIGIAWMCTCVHMYHVHVLILEFHEDSWVAL